MKKNVRVLAMSIFLLVLAGLPSVGQDRDDREDLYRYLDGRYIVIGKEMGSGRTFQGTVVFVYEMGRLSVTRRIHGQALKGEGRIEHALGTDKADVLRVRFAEDGEKFEITYLWHSDLDNYPRLSGYLYKPGQKSDSPGMEALFRDHAHE